MPNSISCNHCKNDIPHACERCPHCAQPGIFWNVIEADDAAERAALQERYNAVKTDARAINAVNNFESALAQSTAVIARSETEVLRLASSTKRLYATYYQELEAEIRLPDGDEWDIVRELADTLLFPKYKKDVRFAALSLDGIGLANYGSCSITLRDEMISHRTSVFEENSVLFMKRKKIEAGNPDLPKGSRATWNERAKLCVAKLAPVIDPTLVPSQYSKLLLTQGVTSAEDNFVETHIWGPISVMSIEKVTVTAREPGVRETILKAVTSQLLKHGVTVT